LELSDEGSFAAVAYKKDESSAPRVGIFDLADGKVIQPYSINLYRKKLKIRDGPKGGNFFVIFQLEFLYILDKRSSRFVKHRNSINFTSIACHPTKEIIATGDRNGKIYLWQKIYDPRPLKTELHWHCMPVLSLAFSLAGTSLYSGGNEMVLVKWSLGKSIDKDFLPRFSGALKHISLDLNNDKLAISTDDNAIQIINSQFLQSAVIQNLTRVPSYYDSSNQNPFPIGIKLNPRNHTLVMNGRIGYLQFFSTFTQKMLYNMDITLRNLVPRETEKVLYNSRITKVALSLNWMATVEEWNNNENAAELKLRFWEFLPKKQM
jgi:NET1-associated nuclear protein 1 (U3 small nucleolar RNA-associated protein 17)